MQAAQASAGAELPSVSAGELAALRAEVARLGTEVATLRQALDDVRRELGLAPVAA